MPDIKLTDLRNYFLADNNSYDTSLIVNKFITTSNSIPNLAKQYPKHRLAAVIMLIYPGPKGLELILTKRTEHLPHHAGQISLPGGSYENADKNLIQTALREAEEEIGLDTAKVEILGVLPITLLPSGFAVSPIIALVNHQPTLQADPGEVAEIFTIPLQLVIDKSIYQRDSLLRNGINREFYYIDYKEYYIWGATAGMLHSLASTLGHA